MRPIVQALIVILVFSLSMGDDSSEEIVGPLLSTFQGVQREVQHHVNDGVYKFLFALPQQERAEVRGTDGKVIGSFAFVDPHGEEVSLTFDAGSYGYLPQSAHIPQSPVDTLEVQQARQNFLASYQRVAEYLEDLHSDEDDSDDESSEESLEDLFGESSEEDSDADSDEDSDEDEDKK